MEVHQLKDRASQHARPSSHGVFSLVDHMFYTIAFTMERRIDVLTHKSSAQTFEALLGGRQ